jgi:hypothetical protein
MCPSLPDKLKNDHFYVSILHRLKQSRASQFLKNFLTQCKQHMTLTLLPSEDILSSSSVIFNHFNCSNSKFD